MNYELDEEGKLVDTETGEEFSSEMDLPDTMPEWLWAQHHAAPGDEA